MKRLVLLGAGIAAASIAWCQVDPARTVAVINGYEVKGAEYYRRMEYLSGVGKPMGQGIAQFPPGFLTLEQLITERLILQLAKEKGVLPADAEVQAEIQARLVEDPKMREMWLNSGRTEAELVNQVRIELAQFKITTAGVTITDLEVEDFYKKNPTLFTTPKRAKLRVVVVENEAAQKAVESELAAGKSFAVVASAHSIDISKTRQGEFGTVPISSLSEASRKAVEATKIGQTTPWITTGGPFVKFLVEEIVPEKLEPLTPVLRRGIRRQLLLQRGSVKNDIQKEMLAMRTKAKIDIKQKEFAEAYAKYVEAYLKEAGVKAGG